MRKHAALSMRGFTLVEIIIVSALFLILGGGLLTAFLTGQTSYLSADAYVHVQQEARRALDAMVRELREAGNVSCGVVATPGVGAGPGCPAGTSRLNFQIAKSYNSAQGRIDWGNDLGTGAVDGTDYFIHYGLITTGSNTQLIRFLGNEGDGNPGSCLAGANCRVLANNVKTASTSFVWDDAAAARTLTVRLEIEYRNPRLPGQSQTTGTLTTRVKLRNP